MPDILSGFNPQPLDKLEQTVNGQPWEQVDFTNLGKYNTGQIPGRQELTDEQLLTKRFMSNLFNIPDKEMRDVAPNTFDSREATRYSQSDAYKNQGFMLGANNEQIYDRYSSNWENVWNSTVKFFDKTYTSAASFLRQNFDTAKAITDTQNSQWLNEGNMERIKQDELMEQLYPTFSNPDKRHWYSFVPFTEGSGDFYETFVPQLGFTMGTLVGAVAENLVIDALTGGTAAPLEAANSLRKVYTALREFSLLGKGAKTAMQLAKGMGVRGLNIGLHGWSMYNTAASEAAFEAGMAYNEMNDAYTEEFKRRNGRLPTPQELDNFKKISKKEGDDVFGANMAILLPSNYIMFRNILMPSFARREALEQSTKGFKFFIDPKTLQADYKAMARTLGEKWKEASGAGRKAAMLGMEAIQKSKFLTEGFEESAQRFASTYNKTDAERREFGVPRNSFTEAWDDIRTADGIQEFIAGALGGAVFQGSGSILRRFSPVKTTEKDGKITYNENLINKLVGPNKKVLYAQREANAKSIVDALNEMQINDIFKPGGMLDLFSKYNSSGKMEKYLNENDIFNVENIADFEMSKFLYEAQRLGKLDLRLDQFKKLAEMNDGQIAEFFQIEPTEGMQESFKAFANHIEKRIPAFQRIYEREKNRFSEQLTNLFNASQAKKQELNKFTQDFTEKYGEDFEQQFQEKIDERNELVDEYLSLLSKRPDQSDEEVIARIAVLNQDIDAINEDEKYKDANEYLMAINELNDVNRTANAVEAARKAAIYAADGALSAKERYEKVIDEIHKDTKYSKWRISEITNVQNLKVRISAIQSEIESLGGRRNKETGKWDYIPIVMADYETRRLIKRRVAQLKRLEILERQYNNPERIHPPTAAENVMRYLEFDESFNEELNHDERRELKRKIEELIKLEMKNRENLNMYNFLTTSDEGFLNFKDFYSETIRRLVDDVNDKLLAEQKEKEIKEKVEEVEEKDKVENIDEIEKKFVNGEPITDEDKEKLAQAAQSGNEKAREILNQVQPEEEEKEEKTTEEPISYDEYKEKAGVVKSEVPFTQEPVVIHEEIPPQEELQEEAEREVILPGNGVRTTSLEMTRDEEKADIPTVNQGYVKFVQGMADRMKRREADVKLFFEISRPEMWPEGHPAANPDLKGVKGGVEVKVYDTPKVIIIAKVEVGKDKKGNPIYSETFDEDYQPSKDGKRIMFSLATQAVDSKVAKDASERIADAMIKAGISSVPIESFDMSMGATIDMPVGKELFLEDLEKMVPGFSVAQTIYISGVEREVKGFRRVINAEKIPYSLGPRKLDGTTRFERNGSANLIIDGNYPVKVYPVRHPNLKWNGTNIGGDALTKLIGREYTSQVEAEKVRNYLNRILVDTVYTGKSVNFDVTFKDGKFKVEGQMVTRDLVGKIITVDSTDQRKVKAAVKNSFINILETSLGSQFDIFYVNEGGELVYDSTTYTTFLKQNAFIKKKVINIGTKEKPQLALKTLGKYIVVKQPIDTIINGIKASGNQPLPEKKAPQQPASDIEVKEYNKPWKSDPSKSNEAKSFSLKGKPNEIFELVKDNEEGFYSVHFKTTSKDSLTEEEKQKLIKAVADSIPEGSRLSTWGEITKGGIAGLNRFKSVGFTESGEVRTVKDKSGNNVSIPVLFKGTFNRRDDLLNLESVTIVYTNKNGQTSERTLTNIRPGATSDEISAFDSKHQTDRFFNVNRINQIKNRVPKQPQVQLEPKVGNYAKYKGNTYIITQQNTNNTWQIYDPVANTKLSVSPKNLTVLPQEAKVVEYKGAKYLVTDKKNIISLTTNKLMNWADNDGNRIAILKLAEGEQVEMPPAQPDDNSTLTQDPIQPVQATPKPKVGAVQKKERKRGSNIKKISEEEDEGLQRSTSIEDFGEIEYSELKWFEDRFPGTLKRLSGIVNSNAYATWKWGATTLYQNAKSGTLYHEAWHHFSQMFLTIQEKKDLYNEARSLVPELEGMTDFEVEEFIAEDFRNYMRGSSVLAQRPHRNGIFAKIVEFLRWLFGNENRFDKLYRDLRKGNFARYNPQYSNIMFGKLNSGIKDSNGVPIFARNGVQKSERYVKQFISLGGEYLAHKGAGFSLFRIADPKKRAFYIEEAKQYIFDGLSDLYNELAEAQTEYFNRTGNDSPYVETIADLDHILENAFDSAFNYYLAKASITPDSEEADDMKEEELSTSEGEEAGENADEEITQEASTGSDRNTGFENTGNHISLISDASEETKMLIASLSKVERDEKNFPVLEDENGIIPRNANGYPERQGGKVRLHRNSWGLNEPVNFSNMMNNLGILLEGSETFEEMYNRLSDIRTQQILPEVALLLERMGEYKGTSHTITFNEMMPFITFFKDFQKVNVDIWTSLYFLKDSAVALKRETKRTEEKIKKQWENNFGVIFENKAQADRLRDYYSINPDTGRAYLRREPDFNLDEAQGRMDFLALLGMDFSLSTKTSEEFGEGAVELKPVLEILKKSIIDRMQAGQVISNPTKDLDKEYRSGQFKDFQKRNEINAIAAVEAKYSTNTPSMSFRNPEGNMMYGLMYVNWLNRMAKRLNKHTNYRDLALNNPIWDVNNNPDVQYSLFLNSLFDLNSQERKGRRTFPEKGKTKDVIAELGNYAGLRTVSDEESKGIVTTSMNRRTKKLMDIDNLLSSGKFEIPRTESAASAYFFALNNYATPEDLGGGNIRYTYNSGKPAKILPFEKTEVTDSINYSGSVKGYFILQLKAEMNIIQNLYNSTLPDYDKNLKRWAFFADVFVDKYEELGKTLFDAMENDIKEGKNSIEDKRDTVERLIRENEAPIKNAINDFLNKKHLEDLKTIEDLGITLADISDSASMLDDKNKMTLSHLARIYSLNAMILNMEYIKLMEGPIGFHNAYHKRAKGATSTGTLPITDEFFLAFLQSTFTNTLAGSLGKSVTSVNVHRAKTAVIQDLEKQSDFYNDLVRDFMEVTGKSIAETEKLLKAYREMNVADGQGYCTLDFYRKFRISVANWKDADEVMYRLEVIRFRRDNNLYESMTDGQRIKANDDIYYNRNWENVAEDQRVNVHWVPIKMQHNGPIVGEKGKGVFAPVLDKFSIAPLIPSVIKGKEMELLNKKLVEEGIEYVKMKSGTKKYSYTQNVIYPNKRFSLSDTPFEQYEVDTMNLKEQIITQDKVKDEASWGTQMRKLFIANMFNMGMAENPKFDKILKDYINLLDEITETERVKLYRELGLKQVQDKVFIDDVSKLINSLKKQAEARDLPANVQDSIMYDEKTKSFYFPLDILTQTSDVRNMISGLLFKRLVSIKINGDMLIQISAAGFRNATASENKKYGNNDLEFYKPIRNEKGEIVGTAPIKIKVALTKDFKYLLNREDVKTYAKENNLEPLAALNALLKTDWAEKNQDLITLIGYRIPTQGPNSMEVMRVQEFLPELAGSMIILPEEIVAKSGSDFDIDKMTIIRPSISSKGEYLTKGMLNELRTRIRQLEKAIIKEFQGKYPMEEGESIEDYTDRIHQLAEADLKETKTPLIKELIEIRNSEKKILFNQVINIYKEALLSKEMFEQLVTPNNTNDIIDIAREMRELMGLPVGTKKIVPELVNSDIVTASSNNRKFYEFLSGKRALGIFALNNTLSQLLQQSGMSLNENYGGLTITADKGIFANLPQESKKSFIENAKPSKRFLKKNGLDAFDIERFETAIGESLADFYRKQLDNNPNFTNKDLLISILEKLC